MIRWTSILPILLLFAYAESAAALDVEATLVDGKRISAGWQGSSAQSLELATGEGISTIPIGDLTELRFSSSPVAPAGNVQFYLSDGGRIQGSLLQGSSASVIVRTAVFDKLELAYDRLAGMHWLGGESGGQAKEIFRESLASRLPAEDVLIARTEDGAKALRGRVEHLDADGGTFVLDGRSRKFFADKVFGVVFAAGAGEAPAYPARVTLADGAVASGRIGRADQQTLWINGTLGDEVAFPILRITGVAFDSPRLVYLSDLRPVDEALDGKLYHPWPVCRDHNVSGGSIILDGNEFTKGLGVHSRTVLTYGLSHKFQRFLATVGIDDAVGPRGSAVFRVRGDDKTLFDSGEVRGGDGPRDVAVDVTGVDRLTLEVDYGEWWDISDQADWAAARLVKPATAEVP